MNKTIIAAVLSLAIAPTHAQFVVSDPALLTNDIVSHGETLLKWIDQYRQMKESYEQLQETHEALSGVKDIRDAFNSPVLRKYMSKDMKEAYSAFRRSGYEGLVRKGVEIYRENEVFDTCEEIPDEQERLNCEATAAQNAQVMGDNLETMESIEEKNEEIESILAEMQTSPDMKTSTDLNNRLQVLQAEQQQLATTVVVRNQLAMAQQGLNQDRARQLHSKQFSNTKGIEVDPPTFNFGDK